VSRIAAILPLILVAPLVLATDGPQDAKAQVEAVRQQTAEQDKRVDQMARRVQDLEKQGQQADSAIGERDRAIAELERQLREVKAAEGKAPAPPPTAGR
jgi:septal ring factor EnvC (AmiA/AmiB activator)